MKRFNASLFCLGLILTVGALPLRAQKAVPQAASRAIYGKTVAHVYTNSVLGLRFSLPAALAIQEPHYVDVSLMTTVPGSMFRAKPLNVKSLLAGSIFPVQFILTAAKLPPQLATVTGEQILNDPIFRTANGPRAKVESLGNKTFAYVDGTTRFADNRSYAIVQRGYYLSIVIMYKSKGDLDVLRGVLANADFDWKGN